VAALSAADSAVTPLKRVVAARLIGPERCLASTRAVLLTTSATSKRWLDHLRMCLLLRQRNLETSPRLSGSRFTSDGGASGLSDVAVRLASLSSPLVWRKTILTGPTPRTHQTVRTPLPYGSPIAPAWVTSDSTLAAVTPAGNAGTLIVSRPM
jgi:hypothetical protein